MPGFILITDTHIVAPGALAYGRSDSAAALRRAIDTINAKLPLLKGIDRVIIAGDLTDHGTPDEYAHFKAIMAALDLPWMAVPGNHDQRDAMRSAFCDAPWMTGIGPVQWQHDFGPFSMIGLDTLQEGAHYGELSQEGLAFLDKALGAIGQQPAVIVTHHPWMRSSIPAMDADNLRNGDKVLARLESHPGPVRMVSGHVHRAMTSQIGKVLCQIAPATCHAVLTNHQSRIDPLLVLEPGAISVFSWSDEPSCGLTSDVIVTGEYAGPWPFLD